MELDDLKAAWAAHDVRITRLLAIHERLLHDGQADPDPQSAPHPRVGAEVP